MQTLAGALRIKTSVKPQDMEFRYGSIPSSFVLLIVLRKVVPDGFVRSLAVEQLLAFLLAADHGKHL